MTFACIDFETANYERSSACQFGAAIVAEGQITRTASWLIRPQPFSFEAICVSKHGITAERVDSAPTFEALWPEISDFIGKSVLVAHNAAFDMSVLRRTLGAYRLAIPAVSYLCTIQIAKTLWRYPSNSLPFLCGSFGIQLEHHDAMSDAKACAEILLNAMKELGSGSEAEFIRKLAITPGFLETGWGHAPPQAMRQTQPSTSIEEYYSGRLASLEGKSVSTTGTLGRGLTRDHLRQLVVEAGGEFHETPKKSTRLFVVGSVDAKKLATGQDQTSKHRKALEFFGSGSGIEILSADDFLEMLILDTVTASDGPIACDKPSADTV